MQLVQYIKVLRKYMCQFLGFWLKSLSQSWTYTKAQPNLNLSGPLVSSDALATPFPGCTGLTLYLLCQCVCMSLSLHIPWLTKTGLLTRPQAKIERHTSMCILTQAHNLTCSDVNVFGTPVQPLDPQHFHSLSLPLSPSAAHCRVNHSDAPKKYLPNWSYFCCLFPLSASVCLYTTCLNVCVSVFLCVCVTSCRQLLLIIVLTPW